MTHTAKEVLEVLANVKTIRLQDLTNRLRHRNKCNLYFDPLGDALNALERENKIIVTRWTEEGYYCTRRHCKIALA